MRRTLLLLLGAALALVLVEVARRRARPPPTPRRLILCLGDDSYAAELSALLNQGDADGPFEVAQHGSGPGLEARLDRLRPDLILVLAGLDRGAPHYGEELRQAVHEELLALVALAGARGIPLVLQTYPSERDGYLQAASAAARTAAREGQVPLVDHAVLLRGEEADEAAIARSVLEFLRRDPAFSSWPLPN